MEGMLSVFAMIQLQSCFGQGMHCKMFEKHIFLVKPYFIQVPRNILIETKSHGNWNQEGNVFEVDL